MLRGKLYDIISFHYIWKVLWVSSKTGTEAFSCSTDGQVLWWDTRKMGECTECMILDPTKKQDITKAEGATCLEYEPTIVSFFKNSYLLVKKFWSHFQAIIFAFVNTFVLVIHIYRVHLHVPVHVLYEDL